jgi:hypothetical protein
VKESIPELQAIQDYFEVFTYPYNWFDKNQLTNKVIFNKKVKYAGKN